MADSNDQQTVAPPPPLPATEVPTGPPITQAQQDAQRNGQPPPQQAAAEAPPPAAPPEDKGPRPGSMKAKIQSWSPGRAIGFLSMASIIFGMAHGAKFAFVSASIEALPAWFSGSMDTFPEGLGLVIAVVIDGAQFVLGKIQNPFSLRSAIKGGLGAVVLFIGIWGLWVLEFNSVQLFVANTQIGDPASMYYQASLNLFGKVQMNTSSFADIMASIMSNLNVLGSIIFICMMTLPEFVLNSMVEAREDDPNKLYYGLYVIAMLGVIALFSIVKRYLPVFLG